MQGSILHTCLTYDNVTEVTIPVKGVSIVIQATCPVCNTLEGFELTVSDLDTGEPFKTIKSCKLESLLDRQHQLVLAFAE